MKKIFSLVLSVILLFTSFNIISTATESEDILNYRTDFLWGINHHYSGYQSYPDKDLEERIHLIAKSGATVIRTDAVMDASLTAQDQLVELCNKYGIKIIMVFNPTRDMGLDYIEMSCKALAERYNGKDGRGFVDYIQVWNETDVKLIRAKYGYGGPKGDSINHYYTIPVDGYADLPEYTEYFKAAAKGIHEADSDTNFMINFLYGHWGSILWYLQNGVEIDVIGWDYYGQSANLNESVNSFKVDCEGLYNDVISKYNIPVMIVESNTNIDLIYDHKNTLELDTYQITFEMMKIAYGYDWIKSFVLYELLDNPNSYTDEKYWGIVNFENGTIGEPKPIYREFQRLICGNDNLAKISKDCIDLKPYDELRVGTAKNTAIDKSQTTLNLIAEEENFAFNHKLNENIEIRYNKMLEFDIYIDDISNLPEKISFYVTDSNGVRCEFDISDQIKTQGLNHIQFNIEDGLSDNTFNYIVENWGIYAPTAFDGYVEKIYATYYFSGDATRDGKFNIIDLIRAKKEAVGSNNDETNLCAIDYDNNYTINAFDVTKVRKDLLAATGENFNTNITNPLSADLNGATIKIYQTSDVFTPDPTASKTNRARAEMIEKLQKELNCKFEVRNTTREKLITMMTLYAASGKALCDIIVPQLYDSGYFISSNLCADITRIPSMDCSKEYLNRYGVLNASQLLDGKFAVAASGVEITNVVFFNKRILKEIGYSDDYLYNLADNGKWTWDEFRALSKKAIKDLDGIAGMSDKDQYGFTCIDFSSQTALDILYSMGSSMIKLSPTGELTYNMTDSKVTDALHLSRAIYVNDGTAKTTDGSNSIKFFANGNALFLISSCGICEQIQMMNDEYGVLPIPQVTNSKNYVSSYNWNSGVLMIPAGLSVEKQYNAGAVIQAYQHQYDYVINAAKKEYSNRYFCDEKSGENWLNAQKYMVIKPEDFYSNYSSILLSGTYRIWWDFLDGRISSPDEQIESVKASTIKELDEINNKAKNRKY